MQIPQDIRTGSSSLITRKAKTVAWLLLVFTLTMLRYGVSVITQSLSLVSLNSVQTRWLLKSKVIHRQQSETLKRELRGGWYCEFRNADMGTFQLKCKFSFHTPAMIFLLFYTTQLTDVDFHSVQQKKIRLSSNWFLWNFCIANRSMTVDLPLQREAVDRFCRPRDRNEGGKRAKKKKQEGIESSDSRVLDNAMGALFCFDGDRNVAEVLF